MGLYNDFSLCRFRSPSARGHDEKELRSAEGEFPELGLASVETPCRQVLEQAVSHSSEKGVIRMSVVPAKKDKIIPKSVL